MSIHRDTQGPCPDTFHIGTKDEWQKIYDILTVTFGLPQTYDTPKTYLKMPPSSALSNSTGTIAAGTTGYYWASTTLSGNDTRAYVVTFSTSAFNITGFAKSNGMSVRPFADTAVIPDSSRTVLYDGAEYATGMSIYDPGVYYNSTLGLISLSDDGVDWTSIADKNLGATVVYSGTVSAANSGGFFQRGNNYMFPYTGATTTSSTKANASNFGPGNYFNRPTFITTTSAGGLDWSDPSNNNLWGGVTNGTRESVPVFVSHGQIKTSHAEWRKDTQGPCPKGFHIPTIDERSALVNAGIDIEVWESGGGDDFRKKMMMPFAGYRECAYSSSVRGQGTNGKYWSCSPGANVNACYLNFSATVLNTGATNYRAYGYSLRPFKNEPVNPLNGEILQEGWIPIDGNLFFGEVIARNETLGLISLTYNEGHDCITIADKNLGATEAYYWDIQDPEATEPTLSQANCGRYFQWGNNYGFTWTGSESITTEQSVTEGYGPGSYYDTYYSGSLFYSFSFPGGGREDWSYTRNDNLRGGATNKERYKRFSWVACSDMRGPCPLGFHVPLASERTDALNIITTLEGISQTSAGANKIATDLHLPYAGAISVSSSTPKAGNYRTTGRYRTATATINTDGAYRGNCLVLTTSSSPYRQVGGGRRAFGYTLRAFKDVPVVPDNTWTTIFDGSSTATGAGIFWNQTDGLISLSLNGENWITIADKNVGATEVWNYTTATTGYTANKCGNFFVRGNNFGQPWTSSSTYSPYQSTKIDTTGYGPGNYFNQDIIVTIGTSPDSDWSSVQNDNLWGGVSQGTWRERQYFKN